MKYFVLRTARRLQSKYSCFYYKTGLTGRSPRHSLSVGKVCFGQLLLGSFNGQHSISGRATLLSWKWRSRVRALEFIAVINSPKVIRIFSEQCEGYQKSKHRNSEADVNSVVALTICRRHIRCIPRIIYYTEQMTNYFYSFLWYMQISSKGLLRISVQCTCEARRLFICSELIGVLPRIPVCSIGVDWKSESISDLSEMHMRRLSPIGGLLEGIHHRDRFLGSTEVICATEIFLTLYSQLFV